MVPDIEPQISVILPVYCNARFLHELHDRLVNTFQSIHRTYELIFVNDACPENSLEVLRQMACEDPAVIAISTRQNIGQHRAVLLGLSITCAETIVIMDADLQDQPEIIPSLLDKLSEGYSAVFAGRRGSYESSNRLITSKIFKTIQHWLTSVPPDAGMFVALTKDAARRVLAFNESRPFVVTMIGCTGLPITSIPIVRDQRQDGKSAYTTRKRLKAGLSGLEWAILWRLGLKRKNNQSINYNLLVQEFIGQKFSAENKDVYANESIIA